MARKKKSRLDLLRLESNPWDKLPEESDKVFAMFTAYKDMQGRQLSKTAVLFGMSPANVYNYSQKFNWKERVHEWDLFLDKKKQEAKLKAIEEMIERHSQHSMAAENAIMVPVKAFLQKIRNDQTINNMDVEKLYNLVLQASDRLPKLVDIERKSRGVPTEINRSNLDLTTNGEAIRPEVNIIVSGSKSNLINSEDYEEDEPES